MPLISDIPDSLVAVLSNRPIVLMDIGASRQPPLLWREIANISYYVGFDPDSRDRPEENTFGFRDFTMVGKAVSDLEDEEVVFHLTASPYCSSILKPKIETVKHYSFTELFDVINTTTTPATTISATISQLDLKAVDWLKIDSQGKDVDIFLSIKDDQRSSMLALDVEPGVVDFYDGENTFDSAHTKLLNEGFWLSGIQPHLYPRSEQSTRKQLEDRGIDFSQLPGSPTAIEGSYLRTIESFFALCPSVSDYVAFWIIALTKQQYGFALDIAVSMEHQYPNDELTPLMLEFSIYATKRFLSTSKKPRNALAKSLIPPILHPISHRIASALRGK